MLCQIQTIPILLEQESGTCNWFCAPMLNIYGGSSLITPTATAFRFAMVNVPRVTMTCLL